jgi:hypothetical protein
MVAYSGIRKLLNNFYNSHRIFKQSFFQIIFLLLHLFHSMFDVGRSMFDVRFFVILPLPRQKNKLALMGVGGDFVQALENPPSPASGG